MDVQRTNVDVMVCLPDQLTVYENPDSQCSRPIPWEKRRTSVLDATFLEHPMRPIRYTPHNLDTTGSMRGRSIYRIRLPLNLVVNVETLFKSSTHLMPSFAVWVT